MIGWMPSTKCRRKKDPVFIVKYLSQLFCDVATMYQLHIVTTGGVFREPNEFGSSRRD